jgi:hypothetical protein
MTSSQLTVEREKEIHRRFKLFLSNTKWINTNINKLKQEFPDTYIAVYNKKVVQTDKDLSDLKEKIKKMNLDPEKIVIEFVKEKPLKLLM